MLTILMATNNQGKLREIQAILSGLPKEYPGMAWLRDYQLLAPADLEIDLDVVEDGDTYALNAEKKASAFRRACEEKVDVWMKSGKQETSQIVRPFVVLADDSGLEVDLLNGAPGIHSARFSPNGEAAEKGKTGDHMRRNFLLETLQTYSRPWDARFQCTIAIAPMGIEEVYFAEGNCMGEIIPEERGSGGFGYDPIFWLAEKSKTMAELSMDEKNQLSHRALALRAALPVLERIIDNQVHNP